MLPGLSLADASDGGLGNIQHFGHRSMSHGLGSNPQYDFVGELGRSTSHSVRCPSPLNHLIHIVGACPQVQMSRLHADWPVAGMQNTQAGGGLATIDLVRHAMGTNGRLAHPENPISKVGSSSSPVPASFARRGSRGRGARHEPMKSLDGRQTWWTHIFMVARWVG